MQATIVFIHTGPSQPPTYLFDNIEALNKLAIRSHIYLIVSKEHLLPSTGLGRCQVVHEEDLPQSAITAQFDAATQLNQTFREGFWLNTTRRFFVLFDFASAFGVENIIHIESDVVLYTDPAEYIEQLHAFAPLSYPVDRIRGIASIFYAKTAQSLVPLLSHFVAHPQVNDMDNLGLFLTGANARLVKALPTIPVKYSEAQGLDSTRFSDSVNAFGGIFDAAAIGQYLGGVDPKNYPLDSRGFQNESSDLACKDFEITWDVIDGVRSPQLYFEGEKFKIHNLHVHSKHIAKYSPYNHFVPTSEGSILTGERLQATCDITITSAAIVQFHGQEKIKTAKLFVASQNAEGQFLLPSSADIALIDSCPRIFIYTHFLWYFEKCILPQLEKTHSVILHNSDDTLTIEHISMLDHPLITEWQAFGSQLAHPKIKHIPAWVGNSQWAHGDTHELFRQSRSIVKDKWVYANFNLTHPSRNAIAEAVKARSDVTVSTGLSYSEYLSELKRHRYCLCPRGNNIDSHRFWECQYLDVTPIIVKPDWLPAYAGKKLLVIDTWSQLGALHLS